MDKHEQLGSWVRRFLLEHLIKERNLSPNTQRSYRDTLAMLLPFIAAQLRKPLDCLEVNDLSADRVRQFLAYLEQARQVSIRTRNQRLAAIHSLRYLWRPTGIDLPAYMIELQSRVAFAWPAMDFFYEEDERSLPN